MSLELALTLAAVFSAVALLSGSAAAVILDRRTPERRQLRNLTSGRVLSGSGMPGAGLADAPGLVERRFASFVPRSPKDMSRLRRQLAAAGYHSGSAVAIYSVCEVLVPIVLTLLSVILVGVVHGRWILALLVGAMGYLAPGLWLERRIAARQKQITNGLPDALDLLIVCIEAGSAIDQAIAKASDELEISYPALAEELKFVLTETRAGKPRVEAFKNFASRTKVDDVRALAAMLIQTDRFGTSIAQALRTHAETARTKRRQRAEEKAGKIGVKLVFPLVFCLFPALYVVILGPAIIEYVRVFKGQIMH